MNASNKTGQWWVVVALVLAGLWLAGCGTPSAPTGGSPGATPPPSVAFTNADPPIIIGDSLTIVFSDVSPQPPPFLDTVRGDGTIKLLLDHYFVAAGKTRAALEKEIRDFYVPNYYRYLTVTIAPKDQFYFVGGEVKGANRFQYVGPTTVTRAIQSAGDFTDFARKGKVKLFRVDGKIEIIDCIAARGNPKLDLPVYPGDRIEVPRRGWPWQQ